MPPSGYREGEVAVHLNVGQIAFGVSSVTVGQPGSDGPSAVT
jgi:hypothetical protein